MDERELRSMIEEVRRGRMSRRHFVRAMIGLGLTAPLAAQMLTSAGVAQAQSKAMAYKPTKRGGGGALKTLWWQGATLLNPHFATGTKDQDACQGHGPDGLGLGLLAAALLVHADVMRRQPTFEPTTPLTPPHLCRAIRGGRAVAGDRGER